MICITRVPGAMRHSSCRFAEPGPYQTPVSVTAPALQRTASQELRAALRPGHETSKKIPAAKRAGGWCRSFSYLKLESIIHAEADEAELITVGQAGDGEAAVGQID